MKAIDSIHKALDTKNTSDALRKTLRLSAITKANDLSRWCKLELGGYIDSNPAMSEDTKVPKYRSVVGQHKDLYGRILMLNSDITFVNETRLRFGVEELEHLACKNDTVSFHDPSMCKIIQENLNVEVYSFTFSSSHIVGILSAIRSELESRLELVASLNCENADLSEPREEVLMLKPNFHGVGINLRALWRRLFG
jgi:hypothetical protein